MKKTISLFFLTLVLIHCTSRPKKAVETTDIGIWQGKLLFSDKKMKKNKWVSLTLASDSSKNRLRVDLYTIFYIPIATFVKQGTENYLWIFDEKKYYFSKNGSKLLKNLIQVPLDPELFFKLLNIPSLGQRWNCKKIRKRETTQCVAKDNRVILSIKHNIPDKRIIKMKKGQKLLKFKLKKEHWQVNDENFKLLSTDRYEKVEI